MFSCVARSLVARSTKRISAVTSVRHLASTSYLLDHPTTATSFSPLLATMSSLHGCPPSVQHPAAPVFVGFAAVTNSSSDLAVNQITNDMLQGAQTSTENTAVPVLEMRNRNNRSSKKKANKGKRPCNRQGRRAKKIKVGRRSRS